MSYRAQAERAVLVARLAALLDACPKRVAAVLAELAREGVIIETTAKEVA